MAGAHLRAGQREEARAALVTALDIARRFGMAYVGATNPRDPGQDRAGPSNPAQNDRRDRGTSYRR